MRVLVIDTDCNLVNSLVKILEKKYIVDFAFSGEDGAFLATLNTYDVITLALDLSDMDGAEVCRMIRSSNVKTPILILTCHGDVHNKVRSLDSGADDYLIKPFSVEEFLARVRALCRRSDNFTDSSVIVVGCLTMDQEKQLLTCDGKEVSLDRKEFDILRYLMVHHGYTVSKATLLNRLWTHDGCATSNAVEVHMCELRRKLNKGFELDFIKTIRGFGYKLKG